MTSKPMMSRFLPRVENLKVVGRQTPHRLAVPDHLHRHLDDHDIGHILETARLLTGAGHRTGQYQRKH